MFIVKAVDHDGGYRLFQCERVRVLPWSGVPASGPPYDPQRVVRMYDESDREFVTAIYVGLSRGAGTEPGSCQDERVYVMTEDGKTVDSVVAAAVPSVAESFENLRAKSRGRANPHEVPPGGVMLTGKLP